ncbi:unnamed protein product [Leptosia nina]|uniref:Uncharacterized protein n=1 Tax=Leptosia nina TaxID=320188 RepID=A0AAV1JXB8_9NEOP
MARVDKQSMRPSAPSRAAAVPANGTRSRQINYKDWPPTSRGGPRPTALPASQHHYIIREEHTPSKNPFTLCHFPSEI